MSGENHGGPVVCGTHRTKLAQNETDTLHGATYISSQLRHLLRCLPCIEMVLQIWETGCSGHGR